MTPEERERALRGPTVIGGRCQGCATTNGHDIACWSEQAISARCLAETLVAEHDAALNRAEQLEKAYRLPECVVQGCRGEEWKRRVEKAEERAEDAEARAGASEEEAEATQEGLTKAEAECERFRKERDAALGKAQDADFKIQTERDILVSQIVKAREGRDQADMKLIKLRDEVRKIALSYESYDGLKLHVLEAVGRA